MQVLAHRQPFGSVSSSLDDNLGQVYYEVDATNGGYKAYRYVQFTGGGDVSHHPRDMLRQCQLSDGRSGLQCGRHHAHQPAFTRVTLRRRPRPRRRLILPASSTGIYGFVQCFGHRDAILAAAGVAISDTLAVDVSSSATIDGGVISVVDVVSGTISSAEYNAGLLDVSVRRVGMAKTASTTSGATNSINAFLSGMFV